MITPSANDAKMRRRVRMITGTIGVLTYFPVPVDKRRRSNITKKTSVNRATVVAAGRHHQCDVESLTLLDPAPMTPVVLHSKKGDELRGEFVGGDDMSVTVASRGRTFRVPRAILQRLEVVPA